MHGVKIRLGRSEYLVIDLTEPLSEDAEVYPGDPKPEKRVFSDISKTGSQHHVYALGDHVFRPHADAPRHQNPELQERGIEAFGIGYCFNRACMIDLSNSDESRDFGGIRYLTEIKRKHLEPFSGQISGKGALLIRTGYDRWLEENRPHTPENIPYLSESAAKFIAGFGNIRVIGTDSLTVDPCRRGKPVHASHQELRDRMIVESMVHLHEILKDARADFYLQTTPVRIAGATGGPVVAYAFIGLPSSRPPGSPGMRK